MQAMFLPQILLLFLYQHRLLRCVVLGVVFRETTLSWFKGCVQFMISIYLAIYIQLSIYYIFSKSTNRERERERPLGGWGNLWLQARCVTFQYSIETTKIRLTEKHAQFFGDHNHYKTRTFRFNRSKAILSTKKSFYFSFKYSFLVHSRYEGNDFKYSLDPL